MSTREVVLLALNLLKIRGETIIPVTFLATWFHDAIYTDNAVSDENAPADLAVSSLWQPLRVIQVSRYKLKAF